MPNLSFKSWTDSNPTDIWYGDKKNLKGNGILLPKLVWPTVRKNSSSDQEKHLKFEVEGREFAKCLRSPEQSI